MPEDLVRPCTLAEVEGHQPFQERVIVCSDRGSAEQEADRQQQLEAEDAVWIYLRQENEWVAKRTPRVLPDEPEQPKSLRQRAGALFSELLNPGNWIGP